MKINQEGGYVSGMLVGFIASVVLLVAAISFGVWAFMSRQDYKNNSDQKVAAAVEDAKEETRQVEAQKYAEEAKNPLKDYKGPDEFGGVALKFPKTWSGYVEVDGRSNTPVDNYYHPHVVEDVSERGNAHALRVQVVDRTYDSVLKTYEAKIDRQELRAAPYSLPKVSDVVGMRLDGEVERDKTGRLIILPVRNMTLKIWTESPNYLKDFNDIILPNVVFSP